MSATIMNFIAKDENSHYSAKIKRKRDNQTHMMLNKIKLAIILSKLKVFENPRADLEQYPTWSEIAAVMLWKCYMDGNLKTIADLGAGTGILGIGAALLGAKKVYMVEIDENAIKIAKENQKTIEKEYGIKLPITYINKPISEFRTKVDTIIQNPPFGVQKEHADKEFLEKAMEISDNIYSLHKIESQNFVQKLANDRGFGLVDTIGFHFLIKRSMEFHTKRIKDVKVACFVLRRKSI
ncbi:MAG: METTL5 family protein [Candidatus Woesearchaeota archaeon]